MATRTITDAGANLARYDIGREPAGAGRIVVGIALQGGGEHQVVLRAADITAVLSPAQRAAFLATLDLLYNAALTKGGFTP